MAIYHVDETVLSRNYWYPNEAENWKEYRYTTGQKASNGETHYAISLIQADDRWDLEKGTSRAQNSDLYPGSLNVQKFGNKTFPNSSNYYFGNGSEPKYGFSGVTVTGINEPSTGNVEDRRFKLPITRLVEIQRNTRDGLKDISAVF